MRSKKRDGQTLLFCAEKREARRKGGRDREWKYTVEIEYNDTRKKVKSELFPLVLIG